MGRAKGEIVGSVARRALALGERTEQGVGAGDQGDRTQTLHFMVTLIHLPVPTSCGFKPMKNQRTLEPVSTFYKGWG